MLRFVARHIGNEMINKIIKLAIYVEICLWLSDVDRLDKLKRGKIKCECA